MTIPNTPALDIRNLDALPRGLGCRFLLCITSHVPGVLIAKSWHRKEPAAGRGEVVVDLGPLRPWIK